MPKGRTPEGAAFIAHVHRMLEDALAEQQVTRADLAREMGKGMADITHLLDPGRNMTLQTLSNIAEAIGIRLTVEWL